MKTICLGDSLTYGYGVAPAASWISLVQDALKGEWVNCGICGDTASGILSRLSTELLAQKPYYVLMMGGANDILLTNSFQQAQCAIMAMVHQCVHAKVRPVIGIPTPLRDDGDNPWLPLTDMTAAVATQKEYIAWLRLFVKTMRLRCVDFAAAFEQHPDPKSLYQDDGLHPNAAGHRLMADAVLNSRLWRREE